MKLHTHFFAFLLTHLFLKASPPKYKDFYIVFTNIHIFVYTLL